MVSLAHSETLAWPSPNSGSQSLPLVLLVQTQSWVFDIIFFSLREVQRGESQFVKHGDVVGVAAVQQSKALKWSAWFREEVVESGGG